MPSELERAQPGRDVELGHRPDLRPVSVELTEDRAIVRGPVEFGELLARFG
ncbi:hypothetical protein [Pseudonocardia hierapolitana]|uniref:hypothetical protein n=1 Tax=Pseudonocardia hierapolitana TaxID=1128676 RepID=UPI00147811BC|nr:hypothetical protein [Pseudonocardia hierapolitana]